MGWAARANPNVRYAACNTTDAKLRALAQHIEDEAHLQRLLEPLPASQAGVVGGKLRAYMPRERRDDATD